MDTKVNDIMINLTNGYVCYLLHKHYVNNEARGYAKGHSF